MKSSNAVSVAAEPANAPDGAANQPAPTAPTSSAQRGGPPGADAGAVAATGSAPINPVVQANPLPDPLLSGLSLLLARFGIFKSEDALSAGIPHEKPLQPPSFCRIAEANGCTVRIQPRSLDQISELMLPVILLLDRQEAVLLLRRENGDGTVLLLPCEPGGLETEVDAAVLRARYIGTAIFVKPTIITEDRTVVARRDTSKDWFWGTIWRYRGYYVQTGVAATFINILAMAGTFFTMNVYDRVISNQAYVTLWTLAGGVMIAMTFEYLLRNMRSWMLDNAGKKADLVLGSALYRQAMMTRLENRPQSAGAYANTLREFESVRDFATSATLAAISDLPFMVLFLWVIHMIAGPLWLVPAATLPILCIVGALAQFPLSKYINENQREGAIKHGILVETVESAETIKAYRLESQMQAKYERASALVSRTSMKSRWVTALVTNFTNFISSLTTVAMVVWGVYLIGEGLLTQGALIGAVLLSSRAIAPAATITGLAVRYQQARMSLRSLNGVMAKPTDRDPGRSYLHKPVSAGQVSATSVDFRYNPGTNLTLQQLSLAVSPGERVAVLGRVGSGKSTMLKVLAGLYRPAEGTVKLDDVDLNQIEPADVRRQILYVGQDARLLFGSLRENLKAGNPTIDDETMMRIANAFGVHQMASNHPRGYDMPIGERGEGLSGGQRQAVALARAVLTNPRVMLLDEPTSAMDNATEAMAMNAITQLCIGKTIIMVTHKIQLLDYMQRVIVMDNGSRVADGPRDLVLQALREGKIQGVKR